MRDWLPEFWLNPDKKTEDQKILIALIMSHCINYNTFLVTMIINPILTLVAGWLSLKYQTTLRLDPYTGESLENNQEYFQANMFVFFTVLMATSVHHYLVQKDLLTQTIETCMV